MKHLLNKQSSRQLALLEVLWENDWLTISEIVKKIGGVEKTIRTDIKQLNEMIEPLKIETSFKYGVFLNKDLRISKSYLYSLFLQKSIECKMLEIIFMEPQMTKGELCDKLFISETQLHRLHTRLNISMKKYGIRITNDLQFIGNEKNIRKLFSSLFYEKYHSLNLLLTKEEFQLIDTLLNSFYMKNKDKMIADDQYNLLLNKMRIIVWVALCRCKSGNYFQEKTTPFDYSMITNDNHLKEKWQLIFEIKLTDQVLFNLFEYFQGPFSLNETWSQAGTSQLILKEKLKQLVFEISQELMINCYNQEALVQSILCSGFRAIGPTFILNNVEKDFVVELMKDRQDIVLIAKEKFHFIYDDLLLSLSDKNKLLYQSIYTLVTQWPEFRAEIRKPMIKIKAALLLDIPAGQLNMLKEEIEYHFRNTYEVDILSPLENNRFQQLSAYDCILTNGYDNGHLENVKVIGVPNYFGEEFVKKLHSFWINKKEELYAFRKNFLI